jgi:DNA-binding MarR family transcriptional regulator
MTVGVLDPLIHFPARLRIVATLAALPAGDAVSLGRLRDIAGLTPDNLTTHLRRLEDAGYLQTKATGRGASTLTTAALTHQGRAALDRYAATLSQLPPGAAPEVQRAPGPHVRVGDADRDAAAAALAEHFAQGRLTIDELDSRLGAVLAATTHGEISRATSDLPDVTGLWPPRPATSVRPRARRGHRRSLAARRGTPSRRHR